MITLKLAIAILAFVLSSGQIVFQTFQQHHAVNPKHGGIKFIVFLVSSLSLIYLAKDIYADFDEKNSPTITKSVASPAEIDYWHGVDRDASPVDYCQYLEKFPNGQFVDIAKHRAGDCLQVEREAEAEIKRKAESEAALLKEKIDTETKFLADKNAQLEKEAKDNAARIAALEQAKTEAELKIAAELKAKLESDNSLPVQTQTSISDLKPEAKIEESLF